MVRLPLALMVLAAAHGLAPGLVPGLAPGLAFGQSRASLEKLRDRMVDEEVVAAGITNDRVVKSLRQTPRHEFVPLAQRKRAYLDMALPIGEQQTISPPFIVAYMTEQLDPQPTDRVLEIGTGSGYQAAVLSPLVDEVYSIEIVGPLGRKAARTLKRLKYRNVFTKVGDGYLGWPEKAPFDKIIVTCSPEKPPLPLVQQLAEGGTMIVPVGERYQQNLILLKKVNGRMERQTLQATLFVPMTGTAEDKRSVQPDAANPTIGNGGFEEVLTGDGDPQPAGWHYLRRMRVVTDKTQAPEGQRYLQFNNSEPGLGCRALQGFPVDGREVNALRVSFLARGAGIRYGQNIRQWPYVVVTYYDDKRNMVGEETVGPFIGDFDWTDYSKVMAVPLRSREAIMRVGLLGAIGELAIDKLRIEAVNGH